MAANLKAGSIGKRFSAQIWAGFPRDPVPAVSASAHRRWEHSSSYDKEVDDQVRPTVVPDHVIQSGPDGKYWGPHPTTGVFGPAAARNDGGGAAGSTVTRSNGASALDQTVWFRPLEDVEKPPYA